MFNKGSGVFPVNISWISLLWLASLPYALI